MRSKPLLFANLVSRWSTFILERAVIPLPPCPKHIQHRHRSPAGDHGGHHSIPFLHSSSLNLDLPQLQQLRRYLLFLEPQSLGFGSWPW